MEWVNVVTTVGFPIVACYYLMRWTQERVERAELRTAEREKILSDRIYSLENKIEVELANLVKDQGALITDCKVALMNNTGAMRDCAGAMRECTEIIRKQDNG